MNSGLRHLPIPDPVFGGTFPAIVQYPTNVAMTPTTIGPFSWEATTDAPLAPGRFPVCVISHGAGGSHVLYRALATHLACSGYLVICPEHPKDNRNDSSLSYTDDSVSNRPIHLIATLDTLLGHAQFGPAADPKRVGIVGHSMGGCAALVLAGGQPWSRARTPIPVRTEPRFRAAVVLAPATGYFLGPGALDRVAIPLLVLAGEHDAITPPDGIQTALRALPAACPWKFAVIRGAGHYSFLSPFPEMMRRPDFPPSQDPAGFDREQFHRELPSLVENFLDQALPQG